MAGLNNVRVITVRWRASILSLGSGDGMPVLVGQKRDVPKMAEPIQYNTIIWHVCSALTKKIAPFTSCSLLVPSAVKKKKKKKKKKYLNKWDPLPSCFQFYYLF